MRTSLPRAAKKAGNCATVVTRQKKGEMPSRKKTTKVEKAPKVEKALKRKESSEKFLPLAVRPLGIVALRQDELLVRASYRAHEKEMEAQALLQLQNLMEDKLKLAWKVREEERRAANDDKQLEWQKEFDEAFAKVRAEHRPKMGAIARDEAVLEAEMEQMEAELEKKLATNAALAEILKKEMKGAEVRKAAIASLE